MGRPETMCPRTNFLGPLVPEINRPGNTMSLECYIPVIICMIQYVYVIKMTGLYQRRDIVCMGQIILGTRGLRKLARGHIVLGRPINPQIKHGLQDLLLFHEMYACVQWMHESMKAGATCTFHT